MVMAKSAGEIVSERDVILVACPSAPVPASLRYDAEGKVSRALRDLAIGDMLGRAHIPFRPKVIPGDRTLLTARLGHVTITRAAHALQAAEQGQRYFARLDDGTIISAPAIAKEVPN